MSERSQSPPSVVDQDLQQQAVALAERLAEQAAAVRPSRRERRRAARLGRLMEDPSGKSFTLALTDEVLRIEENRRAARRFHDLVADDGLPTFLGPLDRLLLRAGAATAPLLPGVVMPLVKTRLRAESASMILPAERGPFARHAARRRRDGVRLNVSLLGEAILGEAEAQRRLDDVVELLGRPDVDYVSVKISSICSQIEVLAFDPTVERVAERLRVLYRAAQLHTPPKFVNLDMEEYRDLHLTASVFRMVLDEPDFRTLDAGIVLQAYLPDSYAVLQELTEWAATRRAQGGGSIKIRIVKGANLAMEQVEAELHGWPQAPYTTKADVDANYKRMLDWALDAVAEADGVRIGVASHNLFDVAWALVAAAARGQRDRVEIEMLEGMADAQARAVREEAGGVLLYAPIARRGDFESTIAYLVRRLDENTGPENFLRRVLSFRAGTDAFAVERDRFEAAVAARSELADGPRRTQDRATEQRRFDPDDPFANEPDTDFSLAANREWVADALSGFFEGKVPESGTFPSKSEVDEAVARAVAAAPGWRDTPFAERRASLNRVAEVMAAQRDRTIACMVHEAGKVVSEADVEVSEAVDFARWYAESTRLVESLHDGTVAFEPLGLVVVASPWNFPYAIPAGGVLAALAAGNTVILKPAPETVATARLLAEQCWEAGIPRDVLQFLPCADDAAGQRLVSHPDAGAVVLTGAWETARMFQSWRPDMRLFAETSGKNAIVVTAAADLDAAVKDIVRSAFGHAGQKCSAASLVIVEASVYDDPAFRQRLRDAVESLHVGPSTDLRNVVGPLIRPPEGPLARALTTLDVGESWLVEPRRLGDSDLAWTPGVKLGVRPGSTFHLTECFGPVLGVLRATDLDDALRLQDATAFGLTGGLHSLDDREIEHWLAHVEVGNAYVNRPITGAIVRRQPFGGWKRSSVGPGAKAGGPNYVFSLGYWRSTGPLDPTPAAASFEQWWRDEFAVEHDPSGLRAETNVFRYRPLPAGVLLRAGEDVSDAEVAVALAAAHVAGAAVMVSSAKPRPDAVVESDDELAARIPEVAPTVAKLRILGAVPEVLRTAAGAAEVPLDDAPVVPHGRIELLRWLREQAVSHTRHRYGLIPTRN